MDSSSASSWRSTITPARSQRRERLAQPSRRQQPLPQIAPMDDDNVHVARQLTMLKSIIQQMNVAAFSCRFRPPPAGRPRSGWRRRTPEPRLPARSAAVHPQIARASPRYRRAPNAFGCSPVAARQNIGTESLALQQPRQADHQRRLARAPHGEIADADHRPVQPLSPPCGQSAHFWPAPATAYTNAKGASSGRSILPAGDQLCSCWGSKPSRAVIARPVAPD